MTNNNTCSGNLFDIYAHVMTGLKHAFNETTWHEFHDLYSEVQEYIFTCYACEIITRKQKRFLQRKCWGVRNSWKKIHWLEDREDTDHMFV